ncbi:hypothetical protein SBI_04509 [Streptomyces bingchenggensis BCW-1]|uniref:Lipoprotein n=1 Tax=Streptomyces bingchenggensis (strain BCW-1) TaxID=749414 RepID=D7BVM8_STRBB|nr:MULTISPECIES: hypothetical protein [Streptomyces]ADI07629.1 hypothetical protein SBI_04509 [Streptomyces bingchenggensis BCW-1]
MGRVRVGALGLLLALGAVACGGDGGSPGEPPAEKRLKARKKEGERWEEGPKHPKVHVAYPYDMPGHCGIAWATFGGRTWKISGVGPSISRQVEGDAPEGADVLAGYMTLMAKDEAVFEAAGFPPVYFTATKATPPMCD